MKAIVIQGVVRGGKVITTNPETAQPCPDDKVNRKFTATAPNQLWGEVASPPPVQGPGRTISPQSPVGKAWSMWRSAGKHGSFSCLLFRFTHRRLCPQNCRLAGLDSHDNQLCSGRFEPGHLPEMPF